MTDGDGVTAVLVSVGLGCAGMAGLCGCGQQGWMGRSKELARERDVGLGKRHGRGMWGGVAGKGRVSGLGMETVMGCVGWAGVCGASWVKGIPQMWAPLECGPKQVMRHSTMQRLRGSALATEALPISLLGYSTPRAAVWAGPAGAAGHPVLLCPGLAAPGPCFWVSALW